MGIYKFISIICISGSLLCSLPLVSYSQVTGGRHIFEFLNLSNSPYVAGAGGILPASDALNVSLMLQNPSLIRPQMHNQLALSYNSYFADIAVQNLSYTYYHPKHKINYGLSLQNVAYGQFTQTDVYGNVLGKTKANDFLLTFSASRAYTERWRYGVNIKWVSSQLGSTQAIGILADVGVSYFDKENLFTFGMVAKNMGVTLKNYNAQVGNEPLPFDLQIGVMKGLQNIPLKFFANVHHLYKWDIRFNDPSMIKKDLFGQPLQDPDKKYTIDKLFRHINLGAELTLGKIIKVNIGFNHLRRSELGYNDAKGLSGMSAGMDIDLKKIYIGLSHSYFGNGMAYNEFGIRLPLNKIIKTKGSLQKAGWNEDYSLQ